MINNRSGQMVVHFAPRASEWTTSVILFLWSAIVLYTEGRAPQAIYAEMFNLTAWAMIFGVVSAIRMIILYVNGALRRSPHLRSGFSFISCFAWFQITIYFFGAATLTTALAVYPVLLILDFYNAYRIAVEARITDESYNDAGSITS